MLRWICVSVLLSACGIAAVWMLVPYLNTSTAKAGAYAEPAEPKNPEPARPDDEAPPPVRVVAMNTGARSQPDVFVYRNNGAQAASEPIVIPEASIKIVEKQEVASEKEGVLLFIGSDVEMGETVPQDKQLPPAQLGFLALYLGDKATEREGAFQVNNRWFRRWQPKDDLVPEKVYLLNEERNIRKLQVGDWVKRGKLLAQVSTAKASEEVAVKIAKLNAVDRARQAAKKTKEEYQRRLRNYEDINRRQQGTVPVDTLMETRLQSVKAEQEEMVKQAETAEAQATLRAVLTDLKIHEIRAKIDGKVQNIYKNHQGDAVKAMEAILRIENPAHLRVEGRLELQEALKLKEDMTAIVEATRPEAPKRVLTGHIGPVNCVAVGKDKNNRPVIVSGSDDRTLRGWDAATGARLWQVRSIGSAVRTVACTPPSSTRKLACFGCADGSVRLFDLENPEQKPQEMEERHRGAVLSVAFSPDGEMIATSSDDRPAVIRFWKTGSRELLWPLQVQSSHSGPVTSIQFASAKRLVTAGRDGRLVVWDVEDVKRTHPVGSPFTGRTNEVQTLGVSPDGKTVLFDQGKELRVMTLEDKQMVGSLQRSASEGMNFSTMALFAPNGKTILTNASGPGKLQLWRTPVTQMRGSELRQLIWSTPNGTATCGAFGEDSSFAVTGTQDHKVLVWAMPSAEEIDHRLEARISLVDKYLDTQSRHVRVWAELVNPGWLIPGMHATMVILPPKQ